MACHNLIWFNHLSCLLGTVCFMSTVHSFIHEQFCSLSCLVATIHAVKDLNTMIIFM
uniref:Uncharacterized protein n=1 Tax=Kalanchoe fedtschenkoi TaxID=63787 RepID=A0A7N1A8A0_KALFE